MAEPTPVNGQITDAVTQSNITVLGDAPAMAMGNLYQAAAHATGMMMQNAVTAQQQLNVAAQAATVQGVSLLYSVDTAAASMAIAKLAQSDVPDNLLALLAALRGTTAPLPT